MDGHLHVLCVPCLSPYLRPWSLKNRSHECKIYRWPSICQSTHNRRLSRLMVSIHLSESVSVKIKLIYKFYRCQSTCPGTHSHGSGPCTRTLRSSSFAPNSGKRSMFISLKNWHDCSNTDELDLSQVDLWTAVWDLGDPIARYRNQCTTSISYYKNRTPRFYSKVQYTVETRTMSTRRWWKYLLSIIFTWSRKQQGVYGRIRNGTMKWEIP